MNIWQTAPATRTITVLGRADTWSALFWLTIGAFVTVQGWDLGIGELHNPGSGFMLFWTGLLTCATAVLILLVGIRNDAGTSLATLWSGRHWRQVIAVILALFAYAFLFDILGFIGCTLALLLFLMRFVDPVRWRVLVPTVLITAFGTWYVLEMVLKIQLPKGVLF